MSAQSLAIRGRPNRVDNITMIPFTGCANVDASQADNRRRCGRFRVAEVVTEQGAVQDLSATGMRIRMGWKTPKIDSVHTFLITNDDVRFLVSGRVTRVSKTGLLSREVGIEFIGMDESAREGLANIVRNTINTEVLRYNQAA